MGYGSNFITITAKKPGTCKRCGGAIVEGQRIRWARHAGAYHLKAECGAETGAQTPATAYTPRCEVCGVDYTREAHLPSCFHYRERSPRGHICRACGADLSREDHTRDCENNDRAAAEERANLAYWERVDNYRELGRDPNQD